MTKTSKDRLICMILATSDKKPRNVDLLQSLVDNSLLARRRDHIVDADRDAGLRRMEKAHRFKVIEQSHGMLVTQFQMTDVTSDCKPFFLNTPLTNGRPSRVRRSLKITRPAVVSII